MRIAHLSDLHFGAHSDRVAEALLRDLDTAACDLIVISGDFTQIGSDKEFAEAHAFIEDLPAPLFAVPGNHDLPVYNLWERFTDPYRRYRRHIASETEPFKQLDGVSVAGLKTTRRALLGFDWSDGSISRGQLRRLIKRLSKTPETDFRIVVAHHPLLHPAEGGILQDIVARADTALEAFAEAGVDMVMSGHFHRAYVRYHPVAENLAAQGRLTNAAEKHRPPIIVLQTGSAISTRLRGQPNAYTIVEIDGEAVELRRRIFADDTWIEGDRFQAMA